MISHAKQIRESLVRTQQAACVYANITLATLRKIEKGESTVNLQSVIRLAHSMGVAPSELMPGLSLAPGQEYRYDTKDGTASPHRR